MLTDTRGVYIVTQTPFAADGATDLASIDTLIDFYSSHGADGFTVLGVAGEAAKLTPAEALAVAGRFIARAGGKPVIVGVSNASVAQLAELTAQVMDLGAAGVMIAPPTGLKTEEELFAYFAGVFARIGDVPTVLQDFPFSTGVWMSVPSICRLVREFPQIQVLKEEDLPSITKITKLRESLDRRIAILTGNNAMFLPLEMGRGIDGPMAGFSHPEMLSGVYRLYTQGKVEEAHALFDSYLPLLSYENQSQWGVAVRKEVLRRRGAIACAAMRQPGPRLTPVDIGEIDLLLRQLQRRLAAA
ncbi:dihydrodipicolinate synthase family protein [Xylophilus rhododendri]|uniref:Dihydrodipicolinate synthase family protein n=1 Tax=Xylophilus rhododendri TaxID=2697032 RepID=A0A857JEA1_9BURK|nr:dihydrodipicolinate synthase family protein [Xylophilus rhododendri]QHJ01109.1 dihydrodipicolinate synthase family protein [Xylophilus rhododendri]